MVLHQTVKHLKYCLFIFLMYQTSSVQSPLKFVSIIDSVCQIIDGQSVR